MAERQVQRKTITAGGDDNMRRVRREAFEIYSTIVESELRDRRPLSTTPREDRHPFAGQVFEHSYRIPEDYE